MSIYKREQEKNIQCNTPCYTGYAINERIMVWTAHKCPVHIGQKTFHCLRRFTAFEKLPICAGCQKDMSPQCFQIHKEYNSRELIMLLLEIYKNKAKFGIGDGAIWWDNKKYPEVAKLMNNPESVRPETHSKGGFMEQEYHL